MNYPAVPHSWPTPVPPGSVRGRPSVYHHSLDTSVAEPARLAQPLGSAVALRGWRGTANGGTALAGLGVARWPTGHSDGSCGQDVLHETTQEFLGSKRHRLLLVVIGIVLVAKGHPAIAQREQPCVTDSHAMSVARQVFEDLGRAAEGSFGVDDPVGCVELGPPECTGGRLGQHCQLTGQGQLALVQEGAQASQELAAKHPADDSYRQKEAKPAGPPAWRSIDLAGVVARQAAARHHAVHVRMMVQVLTPGVQHHEHADRRTQTLGISGHLTQRGRSATHQEVIKHSGVAESEATEFRRQGEHHVMIFDRQEMRRLSVEPLRTGQSLALGTMAVAARIVSDTLVAAIETLLDVATERGRTAYGQSAQRLALRRREHAAVTLEEVIAILPNHFRHFQRWPLADGGSHAWPSRSAPGETGGFGSASRSSRLGVCCSRSVLTCR